MRTLILAERLCAKGCVIVPLHQGLWYFRMTGKQLAQARESILDPVVRETCLLPLWTLGREFQKMAYRNSRDLQAHKNPIIRFATGLADGWRRMRSLKHIESAVATMPSDRGRIVLKPIGDLIDLSGQPEDSDQVLQDSAIKEALKIHLAEYEALRDEIISAWEWQKSLLQYSLLVVGSAATVISAVPRSDFLYLVASVILSALGWAYTEQAARFLSIGRFCQNVLSPRVNQLLQSLAKTDPESLQSYQLRVLLWERFFRGRNLRTLIMGIAAMGKYGFAVLPGIGFALAYYFVRTTSGLPLSGYEKVAFGAALGISLFPIAVGTLNARYAYSGR